MKKLILALVILTTCLSVKAQTPKTKEPSKVIKPQPIVQDKVFHITLDLTLEQYTVLTNTINFMQSSFNDDVKVGDLKAINKNLSIILTPIYTQIAAQSDTTKVKH